MTGHQGRAWEGGQSQGECALKVPRRGWGGPLSCPNSIAWENVGVSSRARRLWAESLLPGPLQSDPITLLCFCIKFPCMILFGKTEFGSC